MSVLNKKQVETIRNYTNTYLGRSMGADPVQLRDLLDTIDDLRRQVRELKKWKL